MKDNFNIARFLFENKLTRNSVLLKEMEEKNDVQLKEGTNNTSSDPTLDEAGYLDDDDDDFDSYEGDLDPDAGIGTISDLGGKNTRKAFEKDYTGVDPEESPEPEENPDEEDFEDPEDFPADDDDQDLASTLQYGDTVEFYMDDEELNDYLNSFRRPKVAAAFLQRFLNSAQKEVDESMYKKLYLTLKNGYYSTSVFKKDKVIAVVRKSNNL